jgi:predicted DNA-binding transcriptional regulator AlpA
MVLRIKSAAFETQISNGDVGVARSHSRLPFPSRRRLAKQRRLTETLERFDSLPDEALVEIDIVTIVRGRSPASIWRDVAAGRLAKPVRVGVRSTRWRVRDVRVRSDEG